MGTTTSYKSTRNIKQFPEEPTIVLITASDKTMIRVPRELAQFYIYMIPAMIIKVCYCYLALRFRYLPLRPGLSLVYCYYNYYYYYYFLINESSYIITLS